VVKIGIQFRTLDFFPWRTWGEMIWPASIPLPTASEQGAYQGEGTKYMEAAIHGGQTRIVGWIDEEGWYEMDLQFICCSTCLGLLFKPVIPGTRFQGPGERNSMRWQLSSDRNCTCRQKMWTPRPDLDIGTGWGGARRAPCTGAGTRRLLRYLQVWSCQWGGRQFLEIARLRSGGIFR
jgi:hypothetical protein